VRGDINIAKHAPEMPLLCKVRVEQQGETFRTKMAGSPKTRFYNFFSQNFLMFLGTPSWIRTVPGGWPARRSEADYGFLADVRLPFACRAPGSGVVAFSVSIMFVLIVFLLDRVAVVTLIALVMKNIKAILQDSSRAGNTPSSIRGIGGCGSFFMYPTKMFLRLEDFARCHNGDEVANGCP
jgi:hypothetical protein